MQWPTNNDITWTRPLLDEFKAAYKIAIENNKAEFKFEGHPFYTPYAFYLIEFLEGSVR